MLHHTKQVFLRWSDLDANHHVRHSAYYDFGAQHRIELLAEAGLTMKRLATLKLGPVLFREECIFKREMLMNDHIEIATYMVAARKDGSRFSMRHVLTKNQETHCAIINIEGAWMDLGIRKLAVELPPEVVTLAKLIPPAEDFAWLD